MHKKSLLASLMLCVCALVLTPVSGYAQTCNSSIVVKKDRDTRSADTKAGTQFTFELTNSSNSSITYNLRAVQPARSCRQNDKIAGTQLNAALDVGFLTNARQSASNITVPARKTVTFKAVVSVPSGIKPGQWACIEVQANSGDCPDGSVATNVYVLVSDPNDN